MKKYPLILFAIIFSVITLLVWHPIVSNGFFGEGFYYFDSGQRFFNPQGGVANPFVEYDIFARLIFDILTPIFHDNLALYLYFQIFVMIMIAITFSYFLWYLTKSKFISLVAPILFTVNYLGSFEMLGTGNYQRFVQRVPQAIPIFLGLIFVHKYLYLPNKSRRNLYFVISISLYFLSLLMGHFASFYLPIFGIFIFIFLPEQRIFKKIIKSLILFLPFFLIDELVIRQGPHYPTNSILNFLFHTPNLIRDVVLQFSNALLPPFLITRLSQVANPYVQALFILTVPIIMALVGLYFLIPRKYIQIKQFYQVAIFALPALFLLGLYLGKVDPVHDMTGYNYYFLTNVYHETRDIFNAKGDRYYYVPWFFISYLLTTVLYFIYKRKSILLKSISILVILSFFLYNKSLISTSSKFLSKPGHDTAIYLSYIKSRSKDFKPNTTIVTSRFFLWPSVMIRNQYGFADMSFIELKPGWEKLLPKGSKPVVVDFDYNKNKLITY